MSKNLSQSARFRTLLKETLNTGPYQGQDKNLHQIYSIGLLTELLVYTSYDKMEIWQHLEMLKERNQANK